MTRILLRLAAVLGAVAVPAALIGCGGEESPTLSVVPSNDKDDGVQEPEGGVGMIDEEPLIGPR